MKVIKVSSFKIEDIDKETAKALSNILCNMERGSMNEYLEHCGGIHSVISNEAFSELGILGKLINHSLRGE